MKTERGDDYRLDSLHDRLFVKVFAAASLGVDQDWNTANVRSGYWRLYENDAPGSALRLQNGEIYDLGPGFVHFIPPDVTFSCLNQKLVQHTYVHFDLIGVTSLIVERLFTKPLSLEIQPGMHHLLAGLQRPALDSMEQLCAAKALVYACLAPLFAQSHQAMSLIASGFGPVQAAVEYIDANIPENITNIGLARTCHVSEDHFVRLFKRHVGTTPAQYIIDRRVAAATQALSFTSHSIEQIAEDLGFGNRYYFSRVFKRRMGIPPAAYRRRAEV